MFGKPMKKWLLIAAAIVFILASCSLAIEDREYPDINIVYPPAVPGNLTLTTDYTDQTISLSWAASEGADIYHIYYLPASEYVGGTFRKINSYTNSKVFSFASGGELEQDEVYLFYVTAGSSSGSRSLESEKSDYVSGVTLSAFESTISIDASFMPTISLSYCDLTSPIESASSVPEVYFRIYISSDDSKSGDVWTASVDNTTTTVSVNKALSPNATYYFDIELYVRGFDSAVATEKTTLTTDKSYQPEKIDNSSISLESNRSDGINVSFFVPALPDYLAEEEVQYRFRIVRSSGSEEVTVLPETLIASYDSATGVYSYLDATVQPNRRYTYTIYAYYLFPSGVFYAQNESSGGYATDGHLLSSPRNVSAEIEMLDESKLNYSAAVTWLVDYEIPEGAVFRISRRDASDLESVPVDFILSDYASQQSSDAYAVSWTDDIRLTEEEGRRTHSYVYTIVMQYGSYESQVLNGSSSQAVLTTPTVKEMNILSNVTASEGKAGRVNLSWSTANTITDIDLDNVSFEILRSQDSQFSSYEAISGIDNNVLRQGYYTDLEAGDGKTVYYRLRATYEGSGDYDGLYSQAIVFGTTIPAVADLSATDGTSISESTLTWSIVTGAQGYRVYIFDDALGDYRQATDEDGYYDASGNPVFHFTRDAGTNDAGKVYSFTVRALDGDGNETGNGNVVKGSLLGPASINVSVTSGADYITVNWNDITGADLYIVEVYAENADVPFISERVRAGVGEFTLLASDSRLESVGAYPLSQEYSFSIAPYSGSATTGTDRVTASWVMPPRNITATKGHYRDMVIVSWDSVDGANGYNVYRRVKGSGESWAYLQYSDTNSVSLYFKAADSEAAYEYTVRTVSRQMVGPYQRYFENDAEYPDELANFGVPLMYPDGISSNQTVGSGMLRISFAENKFATGYEVTLTGIDGEYHTYTFSADNAEELPDKDRVSIGSIYRDGDRLVCYVMRPMIRYDAELTAEVRSLNANAPVETNRSSFGYTIKAVPADLYPAEIVNLLNNRLSVILRLIDTRWNGDWWSTISYDLDYSYENVVAKGEKGPGGTSTPGYVIITDKTVDGLILSGAFGFDTTGIVPQGENNLESLTGSSRYGNNINITLPYGFGSADISFDNVSVDNSSGNYNVTYNGETTSVPATTAGLVYPF